MEEPVMIIGIDRYPGLAKSGKVQNIWIHNSIMLPMSSNPQRMSPPQRAFRRLPSSGGGFYPGGFYPYIPPFPNRYSKTITYTWPARRVMCKRPVAPSMASRVMVQRRAWSHDVHMIHTPRRYHGDAEHTRTSRKWPPTHAYYLCTFFQDKL